MNLSPNHESYAQTMKTPTILALLALALTACDGQQKEDLPSELPAEGSDSGGSDGGSDSGEESSEAGEESESSTGADFVCALDLAGPDACRDIVALIDLGACDHAPGGDCVAALGRLVNAELVTIQAATSVWGACDLANDPECVASHCAEPTICGENCGVTSECMISTIDYATCMQTMQCPDGVFCTDLDADAADKMCTELVALLG